MLCLWYQIKLRTCTHKQISLLLVAIVRFFIRFFFVYKEYNPVVPCEYFHKQRKTMTIVRANGNGLDYVYLMKSEHKIASKVFMQSVSEKLQNHLHVLRTEKSSIFNVRIISLCSASLEVKPFSSFESIVPLILMRKASSIRSSIWEQKQNIYDKKWW